MSNQEDVATTEGSELPPTFQEDVELAYTNEEKLDSPVSQSQTSIELKSDVTKPLNSSDSNRPASASSSDQSRPATIEENSIEVKGSPNVSKINFESPQYQDLGWKDRALQFQAGAKTLVNDPRKYFQLEERGTTVCIELRGAFATFLTMSYILIVNPSIISGPHSELGLTFNRVLTATAVSAAICNFMMGLFTNFPITIAAGMGLNAFISYSVIPDAPSWEAAMGLVVLDGMLILVLVLIGLREAVLNAIPVDIKRAISVGIGLFIAFIGVVDSKMVHVPSGSLAILCNVSPDIPMPPVAANSFKTPEVVVCVLGFLVTAVMLKRKIPGAIIIGIIFSTIVAACYGLVEPMKFEAPDFHLAFKADITAPFRAGNAHMWVQLFSLTMVDFYDTLGTMTAVASKSGLTSPSGRIPNSSPILVIDSLSAAIGGLFGASSNTAYIEACTGICEGARTGLHSIFVGGFFLLSIGVAPIAAIVPKCATAPALLLIGFMMCEQITKIKFDLANYHTGIPSFLTLMLMPMTYSIAHGIGYGFISYTIIMLGSGNCRDVSPLMYICALCFLFFFIFSNI